ncbi:nicotinate-nucleotide diphosphorylase (carboxylating) [Coniothyrium glycines]
MRSTMFPRAVLATALTTLVNAQIYTLTDDLSYTNFFPAFSFYSGPDPTKGFVQYQNHTAAISQNLVGHLEDTKSIFLGVDYTTSSPTGRSSVRLESTKTWNRGLLIADILHMPSSQCGSWPAFWLLSGTAEWPVGGEIDILEGVNDYETNAVTLHTSTGCVVDNTTVAGGAGQADGVGPAPLFTGDMTTANCDVKAPNQGANVGCSIHAPASLSGVQMGGDADAKAVKLASYGTPFNEAGGGVYAMEWTDSSITVWFFSHADPNTALLFPSFPSNSTVPDPSQWPSPLAHFSGNGCDFAQRFKDMKIIFDTTFCGEWAGREWEKGGCKAKTGVDTCEKFVEENPEAFTEAFWEVRGLKWYQKGEGKAKGGVKARGRKYRW